MSETKLASKKLPQALGKIVCFYVIVAILSSLFFAYLQGVIYQDTDFLSFQYTFQQVLGDSDSKLMFCLNFSWFQNIFALLQISKKICCEKQTIVRLSVDYPIEGPQLASYRTFSIRWPING